jgi:hypothetical protein
VGAITYRVWHTTALPKRTSKKSKLTDISQLARAIVEEATGDLLTNQPPSQEPTQKPIPQKNPAAVALGKLDGRKGGEARAKKLSPEQRKVIAQKAARARWGRQP